MVFTVLSFFHRHTYSALFLCGVRSATKKLDEHKTNSHRAVIRTHGVSFFRTAHLPLLRMSPCI
jgi:hypothetical protein